MKILKSTFILCLIILSITSSIYASEITDAAEAGDIVTVKEMLTKDPNLIYESNSNHDTLLHCAVDSGSKELVEFLLNKGIDINDTGVLGMTPLYLAIEHGFYDIAEVLINNGADINTKDKYGDYCINRAACRGFYDIVRLLISKGADIYVKDKFGNTVLHYGAKSGSVELVNLLLDKGLDINAKNAEGISILHYAAESGSLELVKFLLDRGADINVKTTEGTTILHYAAKSGSVELVKFLLDKGLDVNAIGRLDLTPLEEAIRSHSVKLTEFLFDKVKPAEKKRIAEYAALYNAIDIIKLILSKNLIDKDEFIHELLSEASYREQTEIIKFLLSIGVDINMTIKGSSPLIIAIDKGEDFGPSNDFIEFMILQGANINVKDRDGMTPLLYAAKYGYIGIVSVLLNNGADPTICDKEKFAPLHYAKDDVMQELIIYALEMKEKQVIFSRLLHKQAKMNLRIHYNQR